MKRLLLMFAVAATIFAAQSASAYCRTDPCNDDGDGTIGSRTLCCADAGPVSGNLCGQISVGGVDVLGGCCGAAEDPRGICSGCVGDIAPPGGPGSCGTAAVDACDLCGCVTDTGCVGD